MEFRVEFDAGKPLMINGAIQASHSDVSLEKVGIFFAEGQSLLV